MLMTNTLNSFVNFSIVALVAERYRANIIVIKDSKFCASALTLLSYLSTSWLRFSYLFVYLEIEVADLVKSKNLYSIFVILIALSVNFFISILLQLSSNSNSESDSSFRTIYRNNPLIYNRTALFLLNYFFLISFFAINLN